MCVLFRMMVCCMNYKHCEENDVLSVWMSSSAVLSSVDTYQQTDELVVVSGSPRGLSLYASVQRDPELTLL